MSDFLKLIESYNASTSNDKIYLGEGLSVRSVRHKSPEYQQAFTEAAKLVGDVAANRVSPLLLKEAMGTSDFPILFGNVLEQMILGSYTAAPTSWRQWCKTMTVPNFNVFKPKYKDGGADRLREVKPQTEYPMASFSEGEVSVQVRKYGEVIPFSWEASINDDFNIIRETPRDMGLSVARTEEYLATSLVAGASGPDGTFFSESHGNLLTKALSQSALEEAFQCFSNMADASGEPIINSPSILMVPPGLELTAKKIVSATQLMYSSRTTSGSNTNGYDMWGTNFFGNLKIVTNYYLPIITTDSSVKSKQWYLFTDPNQQARPGVTIAHLRGHETPEIFMKSANMTRVGGGQASEFDGDFETDSISYKVRHVVGGAAIDYRMALGSTGQN